MWSDLWHFIQISRPLNVFISLLTFGVACCLALDLTLDFLLDGPFWGTGLTIVVIAASGYWINDVYDFRIDRINKPGKLIVNAILSVKKVLTVYFVVNGAILVFSLIYLGLIHRLYHITFINFLSVALLFLYARYLKRIGLPGNFTIAFLIALVILLAGFLYQFDLQTLALAWAMLFGAEITLIREITKDVEDIKGDLQFRLQTLPIQIGIKGTKRVLAFLYGVFLLSCYLPFFYAWYQERMLWLYLGLSILLVQIPILIIFVLMRRSAKPEDFGHQSRYLKYVMLSGMLTLFFLI